MWFFGIVTAETILKTLWTVTTWPFVTTWPTCPSEANVTVCFICVPLAQNRERLTYNFSSGRREHQRYTPQMGLHQRIVYFNNYDCRQLVMESPHDTSRLRYIISDCIYMVLKSKIFIERNAKEFDWWNFDCLIDRDK